MRVPSIFEPIQHLLVGKRFAGAEVNGHAVREATWTVADTEPNATVAKKQILFVVREAAAMPVSWDLDN